MQFTKQIGKELFFETVVLVLGVASIALFYSNNLLLTLIVIVIGAFAVKLWHQKDDIYLFASGAVIGSAAEMIAIYFGAWQYANPSFLGIPTWLPFVWGFAVMFMKRMAATLSKIFMK